MLEKSNIGFVQTSKKTLSKIKDEYQYKSDFIERFVKRIDTLCNEPLNLAVMGEFNAGKSSFINKLLGVDILPTGIVPKTATIIKVKYSNEPRIEIHYKKDGETIVEKSEDLKIIKLYQNAKDIHTEEVLERISSINEIVIYIDNKLLKNFTFIDTPGFNHDVKMDETTRSIFKEVDIVIWLVAKNQASKKSEIDELQILKKHVDNIMLVVNKSDINDINEDEQLILDSIKDKFTDIITNMERIHFVSSKKSLDEKLENKFQNFMYELKHGALENDVRISENLLKNEFVKFQKEIAINLEQWKNLSSDLSQIMNDFTISFNHNTLKNNIESSIELLLKELLVNIIDINTEYKKIDDYSKEYIAYEFLKDSITPMLTSTHMKLVKAFIHEYSQKVEMIISADMFSNLQDKEDILVNLHALKSGMIEEIFKPMNILGAIKFYIYQEILSKKKVEIDRNAIANMLLVYEEDLSEAINIITKSQYILNKMERLLDVSHQQSLQIEKIQKILGNLND